MKIKLFVAAAFALSTSAAFAQTVAPGTAPGATTGNPSNMPSAGTPADSTRSADKTHKHKMRDGNVKMKTKTNADGTLKTKM